MHRLLILTLGFAALLLVACGGGEPAPPTATPPPTPPLTPTAPPTSTPDGYPPPPTPVPLPTGYADQPAPEVPPSGYPAGDAIWVLRARGEQCTDESAFEYQTLDDAVAALTAAGAAVMAAETVGLMVCEACSCPTSEHYRAQIAADELETALSLGWYLEER